MVQILQHTPRKTNMAMDDPPLTKIVTIVDGRTPAPPGMYKLFE